MRWKSRGVKLLLFLGVTVTVLPDAHAYKLTDLSFGGNVSYNMLSHFSGTLEGLSEENTEIALGMQWKAYLFAPWLAKLDGNLRFTRTEQLRDGLLSGSASISETTNDQLTGAVNLNLFKFSSFPATAHYSRHQLEVTDNIVLGDKVFGQKFRLTQNYRPNSAENYFGTYINTLNVSEITGAEEVDSALTVDVSRKLGLHRFSFAGNFTSATNTSGSGLDQASADSLGLSFSHRISKESFSTTNSASFGHTESSSIAGGVSGGVGKSETVQMSNNSTWRNASAKWVAETSANILHNETGVSGTALDVLSLGASYRTPFWKGHGTVSGSYTSVQSAAVSNTDTQTLRAAYRPTRIRLYDTTYNWGTSISARNTNDSASVSDSELSETAQHSLSIDLSEKGSASRSSLSFSQDITANQNSVGGDTTTLGNGAGWSWGWGRVRNSISDRISASTTLSMRTGGYEDTNYLSGEIEAERVVPRFAKGRLKMGASAKFNISTNSPVSPLSQLTETEETATQNISAKIDFKRRLTRWSSLNADFHMSATFVDTNGSVDEDQASDGTLSYQNGFLFGVPRLNFTSALSVNSGKLVPFITDPELSESISLVNSLSYRIGRISISTGLSFQYSGDAEMNGLFNFTLSRGFGSGV